MVEDPLVSVLMTAYNRQDFIAEAIESVLASHYSNFELIVVDDGSSDSTVSIARNFAICDKRVKVYVNDQNLGDYLNRNKAATYAKGKYIKYLDSDDKIYSFSLNIMVEAMEKNPEIILGLCYSFAPDDGEAFPIIFSPERAYYHHFFRGGLLFKGPSASIIRADYFHRIGGFSGTRYIGDTELWLKISQTTSVLMMQPALIWWRRHNGQEFNLGHVNEDYLTLNFKLNERFLTSPDCPLQERDRLAAIRNYKNLFAREIIYKIAIAKFSDAQRMMNYSKMSLKDILKGLVPINKINKLLS